MLIISIMFMLSFAICAVFIHSKWRKYSTGWPFKLIDSLRSYNVLSGVWPCDDGFVSLIFSAFRHTLIPFIFTLIIWFVNNNSLNTVLLYLTLLYAIFTIPRYKERKKDYNRNASSEHLQEMLKPVKSACFSVVVCAFANYLILLCCYGMAL